MSNAFIEFLEHFDQNTPILTGLNATYLYRVSRECFTKDGEAFFDDLQGMPTGHFVVLCGYDNSERNVVIADPFRENSIRIALGEESMTCSNQENIIPAERSNYLESKISRVSQNTMRQKLHENRKLEQKGEELDQNGSNSKI